MRKYKFTIMMNDYSKREVFRELESDDKAYSYVSKLRSDDSNVVAVTFSRMTKPNNE